MLLYRGDTNYITFYIYFILDRGDNDDPSFNVGVSVVQKTINLLCVCHKYCEVITGRAIHVIVSCLFESTIVLLVLLIDTAGIMSLRPIDAIYLHQSGSKLYQVMARRVTVTCLVPERAHWTSSTGITAESKIKPRLPDQWAVNSHRKDLGRMKKGTSRLNEMTTQIFDSNLKSNLAYIQHSV